MRMKRAFSADETAAIRETYVNIEPVHLNAYVMQETFRFNERKDVDGGRFHKVLRAASLRSIYKELTGNESGFAPT